MTTEIPIKFINKTGKTDFHVIVCTRNFSTRTPETLSCAWQTIDVQSSSSFYYPISTAVVAFYTDSCNKKNTMGPFPAKLGSTWNIDQDDEEGAPVLNRVKAPPNPNNTIVVQNTQPDSWTGRKYNIGLYKSGKLLVVEPEVNVGDQADFMLKPTLFFSVDRNKVVRETFTSLEITQCFTPFDLSNYPNGLKVTLTQEASGGRYIFTGDQMHSTVNS